MSAPNTDVKLDSTEPSWIWDQLSTKVDALIAAWESGHEPKLADFLGDVPAKMQRLLLVELIKVDLEYRWRDRRAPKQIEEYLAEFADLAGSDLPCDLIYEEYHIRKQLGEEVSPQLYYERFPQQARQLGRLLGLESPQLTTTLVRGDRAPQVSVGDQIEDFDLLTELGKGAFASVFLARQRSMQRLVALKVSGDRGSEPQTMAQLDHPNIVRVYDQRRLPERKLRLLYMQYIAGGTLESVRNYFAELPPTSWNGQTFLAAIDKSLDRRGEVAPGGSAVRHKLGHASWPEVICWLGARLASALSYSHGIGVLHRDIKPANVLVASDGSPKLADFNISFSSKLDGVTPATYFGGSLAYMSPEQMEAYDPAHEREPDELDGRSDIYSLAVMLWELLTGSRPFPDEASPGSWSQQLGVLSQKRHAGVSAEVRRRLPDTCPAGLEAVLLRCLSPRREDRFENAAELSRHLDLCLKPRAQRLLQVPRGWLRSLPSRFPLPTLIMAGLLPNIVMSVLNIFYNWNEIIVPMSRTDPAVRDTFLHLLLYVVNGVAFPTGVACVLIMFRPVLRAVRQLSSGKPLTGQDLPRLRARCLSLGDWAALVSALEWTATGFVFPTWLQLPGGYFLHFVTSQVLCGLISATMTFFFVTHVAVRLCYPWLVRFQATSVEESGGLAALGKRLWIYFGGAVSVPFLAIFPLALLETGKADIAGLAAVGLAAFALAFWLDKEIRGDLAALALVINPSGDSLSPGETDSYWTSSR